MKKTILFIVLTLFISACAGEADNAAANNPDTDNPASSFQPENDTATLNAAYENALSVEMQMALGTLALESSDQAISAEQAANFATLWKAIRSLSDSETVAEAELAAVFNQIQNTFTDGQISAISNLELTFEDLPLIAETLGLELSRSPGEFNFDNLSPEEQATREAVRESGGFPGGGPGSGLPGGGPGGRAGGGPGGEGLSPEARQTAIAERGGRGGVATGINPFLLEAIINFLVEKAP